eukprot:TRINITY_DN1662_c0_g4_i2.p1 TRINITY_DN1662_c0_g4~~TRINITY_DN1662_c0_g4_i2.p1  ORF type:complete len:301 (-),score=80.12 TRINITY_DN1662_c0_g4_i2:66-968(-)
MQGWRSSMEDAHLAVTDLVEGEDSCLFGVFDGHGGKEVAKFCEMKFGGELVRHSNFKGANQDVKKALEGTFFKMDELISTPEGQKELKRIKTEETNQYNALVPDSFAGCTANVALLHQNTLYVANAGDSRCVLSSKGQAIAMSYDHKPENDEERRRIINAGGYVTEGRVNGNLNLSRAIGDLEYKKNKNLKPEQQLITAMPEIQSRTLTDSDEFIIMGCDGIWEQWSNQEMVDFIKERLAKGVPHGKITEEILDANCAADTSTGYGCDNMTCILVVFTRNQKTEAAEVPSSQVQQETREI